ncbi:hypothetical protein Nepgr_014734 [Nepenthes gracilis]|uniref:Uncharacterized protein n=1 Tax=Nepenthes gracilis TaxID=150966 RepID=A0AAD3SKK0_NEPGR|nr:hypothetical protein Nepgr_014734 [Nepenthes gracilis]
MFDPVEPASVHNIVVNVVIALTPSHGELTLHSSNEEWRDRMPSGPDLLEADPNSAPCQSVKPASLLVLMFWRLWRASVGIQFLDLVRWGHGDVAPGL